MCFMESHLEGKQKKKDKRKEKHQKIILDLKYCLTKK